MATITDLKTLNASNLTPPTLIQKLAKIRKIADAVTKSKKGFNYSYADITDILAKVKAGMDKYNVSLIPVITPETTEVQQVSYVNTKMDRQGKPYDVTTSEFCVKADMTFVWVDDDTGDMLNVAWSVMGSQSDPSQAFGSGLTYCTRYFLTNYFQIPQVDTDVDTYRSKQQAAAEAEDIALAKAIIENLHRDVIKFLSDNPDARADLTKLIKRYVKSGDYNKITDPELAGKLYNEFKETFLNNSNKEEKEEQK